MVRARITAAIREIIAGALAEQSAFLLCNFLYFVVAKKNTSIEQGITSGHWEGISIKNKSITLFLKK